MASGNLGSARSHALPPLAVPFLLHRCELRGHFRVRPFLGTCCKSTPSLPLVHDHITKSGFLISTAVILLVDVFSIWLSCRMETGNSVWTRPLFVSLIVFSPQWSWCEATDVQRQNTWESSTHLPSLSSCHLCVQWPTQHSFPRTVPVPCFSTSLFTFAITEFLILNNLKKKEICFDLQFWKYKSMHCAMSAQLLVRASCCSMHGRKGEGQTDICKERARKSQGKSNSLHDNPILRKLIQSCQSKNTFKKCNNPFMRASHPLPCPQPLSSCPTSQFCCIGELSLKVGFTGDKKCWNHSSWSPYIHYLEIPSEWFWEVT
jgi:hypothetical protein